MLRKISPHLLTICRCSCENKKVVIKVHSSYGTFLWYEKVVKKELISRRYFPQNILPVYLAYPVKSDCCCPRFQFSLMLVTVYTILEKLGKVTFCVL